ncbi:MAG: S-layer homology domain-containing protein [Oscillospiraceae bacterium]|nr:S-layer homology domain-containing protein [Oscillospiraceae bacterium]
MRRFLCLLLAVMLLAVTVSAAPGQVPYAIRVNLSHNTVTIYELDETGAYTVPVKAMICSTARDGYITPTGTFYLKEFRSPWRLMLDGTYGQYATCFQGHYLFHSICYADDSHDAMIREAYNSLGEAASMGCVRLQTCDAKWIYDNCPAGTPVTVYEDPASPGPLGKPEKMVAQITEEMHNGWDPTDPAPENPWRAVRAQSLELKPQKLTITSGDSVSLQPQVEPQAAMLYWSSEDEDIIKVSPNGTLTALSAGKTTVTVHASGGLQASCTVTVKGELLPFDDLIPGAWYYPSVRQALEMGAFSGTAPQQFSPDVSMSRAMMVQVLRNLEKKPADAEDPGFADVEEDSWYFDAVAWAVAEGLVSGVSQDRFVPDRAMTRQELAVILWRQAGEPEADEVLSYEDADAIAPYAHTAMAWMTREGFLQGSGDLLRPAAPITRIEAAAILVRMKS